MTRTLSGRPKRNYRRRNSADVIVYVLISFHSRDVLCTLGRFFLFGLRRVERQRQRNEQRTIMHVYTAIVAVADAVFE